MTQAGDFAPPTWLRGPHVQSVLSSSPMRRRSGARALRRLGARAVEHVLDAGDGVRLQGFHTTLPREPRGLVLLLHGWEGSSESGYMLHTAARLLGEGCDVFRLNFRDHGDTHHLNRELFHSCRIDEVVGAVAEVARRFSDRPLVIGGFSLGGNFALRVALRAPAAGIPLAWTFAVCPAISPQATLGAIEASPWFYEHYFLHKWRGSLRRKQALFPDVPLFTRAEMNGNLRELTRDLVRRHTDFGSLENYLDGYALGGATLAALQVPTAILAAADDPVIPIADFRTLQLAPSTELGVAEHGGHCGFIKDWRLRSWAEDFISERLRRVIVG